jgi:FkbM family methyltransferase
MMIKQTNINDPFHAQCGEDAFLAEIFAGKESGVCLEVGALDGMKDSTTLHFENEGWSCILVEANPELAAQAKSNRRGQVFGCAAGRSSGTVEFVIARGAEYLSTMLPTDDHIARMMKAGATLDRVSVTVLRVDDILLQSGISQLDFATIDVEGAELEVLQGFDLQKWKPRVLVLEDISGGHDRRVRRYLKAQGYRCFLHADFNDWYALKSDAGLLTLPRRTRELFRQVRIRLYRYTVGTLPLDLQLKLVRWKRRWLGKL